MSSIKSRIARIRQFLAENHAEGFFITNPTHIFYCTGFVGLSPEEREASLYLTKTAAYLYLPRMYAEQGNSLSSVQEKTISCVIDFERDGIISKWLQRAQKDQTIMIEESDLTLVEYDYLKKKHSLLVHSGHVLEKMRVIKDSLEIESIKEVVNKTDLVFQDLLTYLKNHDYTQLTELDIVDVLRKIGRDNDLLEFSFEPIVASGSGGSEPHYRNQNKKLQKGDILLMDFGYKLNGYNSDLTRTIVLGKAIEKIRKMYHRVLECNKQSLAGVKPGVSAGNLHQEAVDFFKKHQLDTFFIHGLGHGIGLEVHEEPYFRTTHQTLLQPGMAVTIEPGLYFPGEFGIRIEDYVVVTENGGEVLSNQSPKELIELS